MTITAQTSKTGPYSGNGTTTVFSYTFEVQDEAHLVVTLADATGVETVQVLNTDYTVSGVGNQNGGQITMMTAPAASYTLTISRNVPITQEVDLENRRSVAPEVLEDAYDKLTQIAQDLNEQVGRSLKISVTESGTPNTSLQGDVVPGSFLGFGIDGNFSVLTPPSGTFISAGASLIAVDAFTGDGTTVDFTMGGIPAAAGNVFVFLDGVMQDAVNYTVSGTTLTFTTAPPLNTNIEVRRFQSVSLSPGATTADLVTYSPAGSGAVNTTVEAKLRQYVSVKDFGAVGDGVTDDTAAIQAAIDAIANTDRVLTGGGFTYNITSQLLVSGTASFNLRDITLSYSGASTNAPLKIDRGGDQYTSGSLQNVSVVNNGGAALIGVQTRKALRQTWINVSVSGFTASGAVGVTLEGSTSNRFFDCGFTGNYIGMKTLNFINASNGVYVPANENKFFGCTWFGCTSDGMQMLGDAAAGGIQSTGNGNGFHACWFEDNGGICLNIENSGDTTIDDCRFESGTVYNLRFEPTMGANVRRHTRILNSNFTGLTTPTAHLLIGANALGAQVMGNKFSGGGVTAWINNSARTTFLQNNSDGLTDFDNRVANFSSIGADDVVADAATIDQLSLTSRGNGNNWTSVTVTANAITYSDTLLVCQTNSTTISTINGGVNGDVLMIKGNTTAPTATTLVSGGNIRLPSGVTPALTFFSVATLINDGNSRWLLVSFSDNV